MATDESNQMAHQRLWIKESNQSEQIMPYNLRYWSDGRTNQMAQPMAYDIYTVSDG